MNIAGLINAIVDFFDPPAAETKCAKCSCTLLAIAWCEDCVRNIATREGEAKRDLISIVEAAKVCGFSGTNEQLPEWLIKRSVLANEMSAHCSMDALANMRLVAMNVRAVGDPERADALDKLREQWAEACRSKLTVGHV